MQCVATTQSIMLLCRAGLAGKWRRLVTSERVNAVRSYVSLLALLVVYTLLGSKVRGFFGLRDKM